MTQFAFLERKWPDGFEAARAEAAIFADPQNAYFYTRRALDLGGSLGRAHVPGLSTVQVLFFPKADISAQGYDLLPICNKEMVPEEVEHPSPREILAELWKLEDEIQLEMRELEGML